MAEKGVNARLSTDGFSRESLAIAALAFLAGSRSRRERFLALSGLGPHNLRQTARDPGFLAAVLDYVVADERLLTAFAARQGLDPAAVARAAESPGGAPPSIDP